MRLSGEGRAQRRRGTRSSEGRRAVIRGFSISAVFPCRYAEITAERMVRPRHAAIFSYFARSTGSAQTVRAWADARAKRFRPSCCVADHWPENVGARVTTTLAA